MNIVINKNSYLFTDIPNSKSVKLFRTFFIKNDINFWFFLVSPIVNGFDVFILGMPVDSMSKMTSFETNMDIPLPFSFSCYFLLLFTVLEKCKYRNEA